MPTPDFIKMHCTSNHDDVCNSCPREFLMPTHAIASVTKNGKGRAVIQTADHAFFHPLCGRQARSIKTSTAYKDVVKMLDGKIQELGDIEMTYYKDEV